MADRGRDVDAEKTGLRARSRSRIRRVRDGEEKPLGARLKKIMKGMGRKSTKSAGDTGSVASASVAVSAAVSTKSAPAQVESSPPTDEPAEAEVTSLQLVLLLMDPSTRRFELLQLEFDSMRARVVDIIAQIPISVTEEAIRGQEYEGVIDEAGKIFDASARLVEFCSEKQILVAVPKGLSVKECTRLARPILSDAQVLKMVCVTSDSGFKVVFWIPASLTFVLLILPFQLTNSGFDVSKWKKKEVPTTLLSPKPIEESKSRVLPGVSESSSAESSVKTNESSVNAFPIIAALAILAIVLQATHNFITAPIEVGVPLPPGTRRSKCGLVGYLPTQFSPSCTNSYLEVNGDGTVSVFGEDRELDMLMVGAVCSKEECLDGILMDADGIVYIGGKRVRSLLAYGADTTITPWPFEETPKLRVKKYKLNK